MSSEYTVLRSFRKTLTHPTITQVTHEQNHGGLVEIGDHFLTFLFIYLFIYLLFVQINIWKVLFFVFF